MAEDSNNGEVGSSDEYSRYASHEINVALELLFRDNQSLMKLKIPIPSPAVYPWEIFLKLNFSEVALRYPQLRAYYMRIAHLGTDTDEAEGARPRTFIALFQFLDFMRQHLEWLEENITIVEEKYRHFKFRAKQRLDSSEVDRKKLDENIKNAVMQGHNTVSQRVRVENMYLNLSSRINSEIQDKGECNLRKIQSINAMEKMFNPDYTSLLGSVQSTLKTRDRLEKILSNWKNIRLPGSPSS